jgi:hypothetical protein
MLKNEQRAARPAPQSAGNAAQWMRMAMAIGTLIAANPAAVAAESAPSTAGTQAETETLS